MTGLFATGTALGVWKPVIGRVTLTPVSPQTRPDHVLVCQRVPVDADGYAGVMTCAKPMEVAAARFTVPAVAGVNVDHLSAGDVVRIGPAGQVHTLYRRASEHNAIFATVNCNSYCLMCSQPPRRVDDGGCVEEHLRLIDLIDPDTRQLGVTGGEPTLLKNGLLEVVRACREKLPRTALHVLSNGRMFYYPTFAQRLGEIAHPNLMVGIPLYSDVDDEHDYIVQAQGAFDQTLIGLQNLGRWGVAVEIRVVVHRLTYRRLPRLAEFIYRNFTFASHVTFMGLELMGFAVANLDDLWIDPWDYRSELECATVTLAARGMNVSIYNHQLCTIPESLWFYARRSISDWKDEYLPECEGCGARERCGGFFVSSLQRRRWSAHVAPPSLLPCEDSNVR